MLLCILTLSLTVCVVGHPCIDDLRGLVWVGEVQLVGDALEGFEKPLPEAFLQP